MRCFAVNSSTPDGAAPVRGRAAELRAVREDVMRRPLPRLGQGELPQVLRLLRYVHQYRLIVSDDLDFNAHTAVQVDG